MQGQHARGLWREQKTDGVRMVYGYAKVRLIAAGAVRSWLCGEQQQVQREGEKWHRLKAVAALGWDDLGPATSCHVAAATTRHY